MSSQDDNPFQLPEGATAPAAVPASLQSHANFCGEAKIVLCCLSMHACAVARGVFFEIRPDWIDALVAGLLLLSTVVGVACGVSAVRHRGFANRAVGILGLLWFGYFVLRNRGIVISR